MLTMEVLREIVVAVLAGLVLLAFIWLYGGEIWRTLFEQPNSALVEKSDGPQTARAAAVAAQVVQQSENPRTYVATAVQALVGGVAAVFLGVELPAATEAAADWEIVDYIKLAYVGVYVLFGTLAIVGWVRRGSEAPLMVRNLAVTFIGLVTPAVSIYLGVPISGKGAN